MPDDIRTVVLFWRFGPYHHARLNAAGKLMRVFGVEACGMDDTYAWEKVAGAISFTRMTLTDRHVRSRSWRKGLRRQMCRALRQTKPQVVAVPGWSFTDALSALLWCSQTNTPAILMSESTERDERRARWKEWMKRRVTRICSAALVGGTPHADYLKRLGWLPERIFFGYDAVDNNHFSRKADEVRAQTLEVRSRLGLPERYFLASARFVEKKNLPRLLEGYARYRALAEKAESGRRKAEAWSLVLLGDGPLRSTLHSQLSTLNLHGQVQLPGFKQYEELPAYYGLASAFVHASTTEQWGLVVNEAMASGLPVLVSHLCGCARDLVREGVNGYTFDPGNSEQLADLMLRLASASSPELQSHASGPAALAAMGQASRNVISEWGPERFALGLQQAVETALRVPPPKPSFVDRLLLRLLLLR